MVIGKLDITVYSHISPVHILSLESSHTSSVESRLQKLTRVHFKKEDVLLGDLDYQGPETGVR